MNPWERDWGDSGTAKPWEKEWAAPAPPSDATALDRTQAAGSGVNRFAVNLAGAPVATALNLWDLAKAGTGTVMGALGAKPENLPELTDRSKVAGSPEWIAKQIEEHGGGSAISPRRPDDPVSRYLHAGAQGVTAGLVAPQALQGQAPGVPDPQRRDEVRTRLRQEL